MAPGLKHGRGKPLTPQTKEVLYNLYKYFESETNSNLSSIMTPAQLAAKSTGISVTSIRKVLSESKCLSFGSQPTFKSPKKKPDRKPFIKLEKSDQQAMRRTIHNFHITNKEIPTMKTIHARLKEDIGYSGGLTTLRKHIASLGFKWKRAEDKRKLLMEKHEIRYSRVNFLIKIAEYREQNRPIVFTDETYVKMPQTLPKSHASKDNRLIIINAGGMDGYVPNALLMFEVDQKSIDNNENTNYDNNYSSWVQTQLIPNLKPNSVVVVNNAPYHRSIFNPAPNSNSKKQQMIDWLTFRQIVHTSNMLKSQLYELIVQNKPRFVEYKMDDILRQHGHIVLRLPPHHSEFNPIENILSSVKTYVAERSDAMNINTMMIFAEQKFNTITIDEWRRYCQRANEEEKKYYGIDEALDTISEQIIINVNDSSDESGNEDDDDDMSEDEVDIFN